MGLFRKKTVEKTGWYGVTLRQFNQIKNLDLTDMVGQIDAAEILLGIDVSDMSWREFSIKCGDLDFLSKQIPEVIIRKSYTINGRQYNCYPNLNDFSVSRYMDFTNLIKTGKLERILAVVLVPKGKEYGEDLEQVYEDILDMSIVDVYAIFNFFKMQFIVCTKTMIDYSVKTLKNQPELAKVVLDTMESCCSLGV